MANKTLCILLPGSKTGDSWSRGASEAGEVARKSAWFVQENENVLTTQVPEILENLPREKSSRVVVIAHGCEFTDIISELSNNYPGVHFFVSCNKPDRKTPGNITFLNQHQFEGAFLCGFLAGKYSRTGVIGIVGGADMAIQRENLLAFKNGAKRGKADITVLESLVGSFEDSGAGEVAAREFVQSGADVLCHTADKTGEGVFKVAKEKNIPIIGYIEDQQKEAPGLVLTSLLVKTTPVLNRFLEDIFNPQYIPPEELELNLKSGIELSPNIKSIPDKIREELEDLKRDIISGKIKPLNK